MGQASRLSMRMTGRMPVPPAISQLRGLLRSARNDRTRVLLNYPDFQSTHLTNSFNSTLEDLNSLIAAVGSGLPRATEITKILDSAIFK